MQNWKWGLFALLLPALSWGQARTVEEVMEHFGPVARERLFDYWQQLPFDMEIRAAKWVAIKDAQRMEVWLQDQGLNWHKLRDYPILKLSGSLRPKMREGDLQVPEGVYRIDAANPNSAFHLSLRIDYPNRLDRLYGELEQRDALGNNIFIHGQEVSWGCLAMGDDNIEELFVLAHDIGLNNIEMVITPRDPRLEPLIRPAGVPEWVEQKYDKIQASLAELQTPVTMVSR
ncbi:L,D-transpeptidase family protein [Ferrimonas gelatinilytica]|uniref:L,D-TPase catalytic domain-containing protein n=1 Tax=Ferrimonas gelatinilytica TaxID=1255257 RepID=A0ABP9RTL7_9GAMM